MKYKNQHFVTEAYLRAWCDPKIPKGYEPYVWLVSKKDKIARKKSPKKVFKEADFYTIIASEGNRNVAFEQALQKIESRFMAVRQSSHTKLLIPHDANCCLEECSELNRPHLNKVWSLGTQLDSLAPNSLLDAHRVTNIQTIQVVFLIKR